MCPKSAPKMAFSAENAQKVCVNAFSGLWDPMYHKIQLKSVLFCLMIITPKSRTLGRFGISKKAVCDRFAHLCSNFRFLTQWACLYYRPKIWHSGSHVSPKKIFCVPRTLGSLIQWPQVPQNGPKGPKKNSQKFPFFEKNLSYFMTLLLFFAKKISSGSK